MIILMKKCIKKQITHNGSPAAPKSVLLFGEHLAF